MTCDTERIWEIEDGHSEETRDIRSRNYHESLRNVWRGIIMCGQKVGEREKTDILQFSDLLITLQQRLSEWKIRYT